jgi:hypothetical protein
LVICMELQSSQNSRSKHCWTYRDRALPCVPIGYGKHRCCRSFVCLWVHTCPVCYFASLMILGSLSSFPNATK